MSRSSFSLIAEEPIAKDAVTGSHVRLICSAVERRSSEAKTPPGEAPMNMPVFCFSASFMRCDYQGVKL
jgi:hypothetical protein